MLGTAAQPLAHMIKQLENLVKQSKSPQFLQPDGTSQYVLTSGKVKSNDKGFITFDPNLLTAAYIDGDGLLLPGKLFMGCDVRTCRLGGKCSGGAFSLAAAPKFKVRAQAGNRATAADGLPRLASLGAIVGNHGVRKHNFGSQTPVTQMAKAFALGAGVAQTTRGATPGLIFTSGSTGTPKKAKLASADEVPSGDPCVLRMPPDTPPVGSYEEFRQTRINLSELIDAKTPGLMVTESILDALMRNEEVVFHQRIEQSKGIQLFELSSKVLVVRMADSAWLFNMYERYGPSALQEAAPEEGKKEGRGFFERLRTALGLEDPHKYLLIAFGVPGKGHFSMAFWLPHENELFRFDSHRPSGHATLVRHAFAPFIDFVVRIAEPAAFVPVVTVAKDDAHGIQQQPSEPVTDANVCAFASAFFLSEALRAVLTLSETHNDVENLSAALSTELHAITIQSSAYKSHRRLGKNDLVHLCEEYRRHVCFSLYALPPLPPAQSAYIYCTVTCFVFHSSQTSHLLPISHTIQPVLLAVCQQGFWHQQCC